MNPDIFLPPSIPPSLHLVPTRSPCTPHALPMRSPCAHHALTTRLPYLFNRFACPRHLAPEFQNSPPCPSPPSPLPSMHPCPSPYCLCSCTDHLILTLVASVYCSPPPRTSRCSQLLLRPCPSNTSACHLVHVSPRPSALGEVGSALIDGILLKNNRFLPTDSICSPDSPGYHLVASVHGSLLHALFTL